MRFGITMFATDVSMPLPELAVAAEERGFDSLWVPEHTHIPTSRRTPPPTGDEVLAEEYKRTVDPLVALGAAAALTERIHLGTGVMLPAQRDPIVTAKAVATLQNLSRGRFELGVGFGWNEDEMNHHGVDYRTRRAQSREHVMAMQALWNDEVASFDGSHVNFAETWSWPKPDPAVPVLIGGGAGPKLFSHIAEYGDGWIPIGGAGLAAAVPELRAAFEAAGRDPSDAADRPFRVVARPGEAGALRGDRVDRVRLPPPLGERRPGAPGARRPGRADREDGSRHTVNDLPKKKDLQSQGENHGFRLNPRQFVAIVLGIALIVFIVQNRDPVTVRFLMVEVDTRQWIVLVVTAFLGAACGALALARVKKKRNG